MGVTIAATQVACRTTIGTQNITTTALGELVPKAALTILTRASADATVAAGGDMCIGATDGTRQWSFTWTVMDAQATTNTNRASLSTDCVHLLLTGSATAEVVGVFSAWITNGITLDFTTAPATGYLLTVVFFAGTDLSVYCGNVGLGNTLNLETDITAPGFRPRVVLAACNASQAMDGSGTTPRFSVGAIHENGAGVVTQRSLMYRNADAAADVAEALHLSTLYGVHEANSAGAISWGGEFANFDASGFSVITRIAGGASTGMGYLAMAFGGVIDAKVMTITTPTATGSNTVTGAGFTSQAVIQGLTFAEAVDTGYANDNAGTVGVSVLTANAQFSNNAGDDDAAAESNSFSLTDDQAVNMLDAVQTAGLVATFTAFTSDGWTLNYTTVQAAAKQWWAIAFQDAAHDALFSHLSKKRLAWPGYRM